MHALPARRERCLLIRSMNTAWLQGPDRRPSQQLGSLQTVQAHGETPARKHRSVLIYSLGISKDFSWSFFLPSDSEELGINRGKGVQRAATPWVLIENFDLPTVSRLIWRISHLITESISIKVSAAAPDWLHRAVSLHGKFLLSALTFCTAVSGCLWQGKA